MKKIPLTRGMVALVDDTDYEWLNNWKWYAMHNHNTFYAVHNIRVTKNEQAKVGMHRLILELHRGNKLQADHIDGNGLNNQRSNLRICTGAQNRRSQRSQMGCTSRYKGVCWHHHKRKWNSRISVNRKRMHLGYFSSEKTAAAAYNQAALKHFGEFALLNTF